MFIQAALISRVQPVQCVSSEPLLQPALIKGCTCSAVSAHGMLCIFDVRQYHFNHQALRCFPGIFVQLYWTLGPSARSWYPSCRLADQSQHMHAYTCKRIERMSRFTLSQTHCPAEAARIIEEHCMGSPRYAGIKHLG